MTNAVNSVDIPVGARIELEDGSIVKVNDNPRDGMWVFGNYEKNLSDPSLVSDKDHPIFAPDILRVLP